MRVAYLDHAVSYTIRYERAGNFVGGELRVDVSPGLVDLHEHPQVAPHTYGGTVRNDPPIFELRRCCQPCEVAMKAPDAN